MTGECAQHTPLQICLKFMNSSYQQDCTPSTRPKQVLIVILPAGCAVQQSMAHILYACPALAQTKYLARHDAVLKVLFFDIMEDLGLIEASPPWYSPTKPQPVYEGAYAQPYWDVPVFGEYQDLRPNRIDARIVNHQEKKVITMEMSCPWVSNRQKKNKKTQKRP